MITLNVAEDCNEECERRAECLTCHREKAPVGRSVPMEAANGYCTDECTGYREDPTVGHLWPGEWNQALRGQALSLVDPGVDVVDWQ
jgi:hypothetical protein